MLAPLSAGTHTLHFHGEGASTKNSFSFDGQCTLVVAASDWEAMVLALRNGGSKSRLLRGRDRLFDELREQGVQARRGVDGVGEHVDLVSVGDRIGWRRAEQRIGRDH